jgi:hypothetical protein
LRLSTVPDGRGVHVPAADRSAQLRHAPPQVSLQHTPSVQKPDAQAAAVVHAPPFVRRPQLLLTHAMPGAQSAFVAHVVLHEPDAHAYGGQSITPGGLHEPCPSHVPAVLSRVPAHDGSTHTVSGPYFEHRPKPSHVPVSPHFAVPLSLQTPRGSGLPRSMGQHVPRRPVWLHDTHAPWHATAQHTPSVQKPDPHSSFFVQLVPFILRPQLPVASHNTPIAQSLFDLHEPKQSCVLMSHEKGAQILTSPTPHTPAPSHVWIPVTAAPSHVPALHTVPSTYARQAPWPSHVPSSPQVATSDFAHVDAARGARPAGTNEHVPIEPCTSQRLHVSPHAESQQTPSTQKPD